MFLYLDILLQKINLVNFWMCVYICMVFNMYMYFFFSEHC